MFACSDEASLARALREPQDEAERRAALWALLGCVESGALMPSSELVDLLQGYQADSLLGAALAGLVLARLQPGPPSLVVLARVLPALQMAAQTQLEQEVQRRARALFADRSPRDDFAQIVETFSFQSGAPGDEQHLYQAIAHVDPARL